MSSDTGRPGDPRRPDFRLADPSGDLVLRQFDPDADAVRYAQVRADPASRRFASRALGPDPVADTRRTLAQVRDDIDAGGLWYLAVDVDDRLAGRVSLRFDGDGGAEIGFGVHPDLRGRGVATRASRLICRHAFDTAALDVVRWHAFVGNWASRRVAWRLGFSFDGVERLRVPQGIDRVLRDAWGGTLRPAELGTPRWPWLAIAEIERPPGGVVRRLREPSDTDVDAIVEAMADERAQTYLHVPNPYDQAHALAFLETVRDEAALGTDLTWVAVDETDRTVACVTLDLKTAEMGWWGHPASRRRGAVHTSVTAVAGYAFTVLGFPRVWARCAVSNTASTRVALAAGMREAGGFRRAHDLTLPDGSRRREDTRLFDLIPADLR